MPVSQVDFLIVGQGLAGSILAFKLIARGQRVLVIDNDHNGSASQVAAGIINPITGHRLNLSDGFVNYLACATEFYAELESSLNINVINAIEQIRLLKNPGQAGYFDNRLQQEEYRSFLQTNTKATLFNNSELLNNPKLSTAKVMQTSIVDTKRLLSTLKTWLIKQNSYSECLVDYSQLHFSNDNISYAQTTANAVIFCEGYQAINNPWLKSLPFKLSKGEILTIEKPRDTHSMLSWGNWLVPQSNSSKLGSNYAWNDTQLNTSDAIREKLLDSLENHTGLRPAVIDHEVGVRPTTVNRQAFVGGISQRSRAYCFNGFGSKGCLTIPKHAELFCDHLINQTPLPENLTKCL